MFVLAVHIMEGTRYQLIESGFDELKRRYHKARPLGEREEIIVPAEFLRVVEVRFSQDQTLQQSSAGALTPSTSASPEV